MTPEDYLEDLRDHLDIHPLPAEEVAAGECVGRVLARDVAAVLAVPPFTNSAMDGFALDSTALAGEGPWTLPVLDDVAAGDLPHADAVAVAGEGAGRGAIRIMTGAPLPGGMDAVVRVEDTDARHDDPVAPATVTFSVRPRPGANVRARGEDVGPGETVMRVGERLGALAPASLASVGVERVWVRRRPRVAVISTGSELVGAGSRPGGAQIPDSDSLIVDGLACTRGAETVSRTRVGDDPELLWRELRAVAAGADLVVTTGGISMGARDVVKMVGATHGWTFSTVAMQPGKPQAHGVVEVDGRRVPVLSLPGNPVSVAVSFALFGVPLLDAMVGAPAPRHRRVRAGQGWTCPRGRRQYVPAVEVLDEGGVVVVPVHRLGSGSHLVASLHAARVLAVVPAEVDVVREGDVLEVMDLTC